MACDEQAVSNPLGALAAMQRVDIYDQPGSYETIHFSEIEERFDPIDAEMYPDFVDPEKRYPLSELWLRRWRDAGSKYGTGSVHLGGTIKAMVSIYKEEFLGDAPPEVVGNLRDNSELRVSSKLCLGSQFPCHQIRLKGGEGTQDHDITFDILANSLEYTQERVGVALSAGDEKGLRDSLPPEVSLLREFAEEQNLLCATSELVRRPIWTGISNDSLEDIRRRYKNNPSSLDKLQLSIATLDSATKISVFNHWRYHQGKEDFEGFRKFFPGVMYLSARLGGFWYYQLRQKEGVVLANDEAELNVEPSRWMDVTLLSRRGSDGRIDRISPYEWAPFSPFQLYPDTTSYAFINRGGMFLEATARIAELRQLIDSRSTKVRGRFRSNPSDPTNLIVEFKVASVQVHKKSHVTLRETGTRCEIGVSRQKRKYELKGEVVELAWPSEADFAVFVEFGPGVDFPGESFIKISLDCVEDTKSETRAMSAISSLQAGHQRVDGLDLRRLFFQTSKVAEDLPPVTIHARQRFEDAVRAAGLNESQVSAACQILDAKNGVCLIHGPPGTGKTVLVCGNSNEAVDVCAEKFGQIVQHDWKQYRYTRFRSTYYMTPDTWIRTENDAPNPPTEEEQRQVAMWSTIFGVVSESQSRRVVDESFHIQKLKFVAQYVHDETHVLHMEATEYLRIRDQVLNWNLTRDDRRVARERWLKLDKSMSVQFIQWVNIVFVTNNSSCHDALENFKPDVIIVDEAGQATPGDLSVPMAMFKETLEGVFLAGDHRQLQPVVASRGRNEAFDIIKRTLFEDCVMKSRYPHVVLNVQYRMHPHIAKWVSDTFYEGQIENHPSVERTTELQRTMKEFLDGRGIGWNNRFRLAISVDGTANIDGQEVQAMSKQYENTYSWYNEVEAGLIVSLLAFKPTQEGTGNLIAEDIVVITPYDGQRRWLRRKLASCEGEASTVKVSTTTMMQGREAKLVLLSTVRNHPGDPKKTGFITEAQQLCVQFSRAREFLIAFGNWDVWYRGQISSDRHFEEKVYKPFRKLNKSLWDQGDVVSWQDGLRTGVGAASG